MQSKNKYTPAPAIIHISWAGPVVRLKVGKQDHTFEMHRYLGPIRLMQDGETERAGGWPENSKFWPVFQRWVNQGKRIDGHGRGIVDAE